MMQKSAVTSTQYNISHFLGILALAFVMSYIPLLRTPFSWLQTYFHEISHGLAALLTGGSVKSIQLHLFGSGRCLTVGGIGFLIAFSGYLGAIIWGAMIYLLAVNTTKKQINAIISIIVCLMIISAILWARDLVTFIIFAIMIAVFISVLKLQNNIFAKYFLKFSGIYVLLDAIKSPLYLIDGRPYGDGHVLSEMTFIPEIIWVLVWFTLGIAMLYYLFRLHIRTP